MSSLPVPDDQLLSGLEGPIKIKTIEEAFLEFAGWNPLEICDERRFEEDLVTKIEPNLPKDGAIILKDFPAWAASLARLDTNDKRICQRFELYLGGIELANGFSELVDSKEQRERFQIENAKRVKLGLKPISLPEEFLSSLDACPPSAGIALGVDRLIMVLTKANHITEVIPPFNF